MQLAIPSAPRAVSLRQIPGAMKRVAVAAGLGATVLIIAIVIAAVLDAPARAQRGFLAVAQPVEGQVTEVLLPPMAARIETPARLRVIYSLDGRALAASGVEMDGVDAERLFVGAKVMLLVDPSAPSRAQERARAERRGGWGALASLIIGIAALLAIGAVTFELRRIVRREVAPLRLGALVWLTPGVALPDTTEELVFPAHYFRDDARIEVSARVRPGRRPVRNGEKVLAAVWAREPQWARVVDEPLAKTLGWYRG